MLNTVPLHLLSQIAKQRQSRSPIQNKSLLLITQSLTLVRTRARDVPRLTTHPALPLGRSSRAEIGATPLVWSPTRPSSERTVIYGDRPLGLTSWHRAVVPDILPNRSPTDFSFLHHLVVHFVSLFSFFLFFLSHLVAQSRSARHTAQNGPRPTFVFFFFRFLTPPRGTFSFFFSFFLHPLVAQSRRFRRIAKNGPQQL